MTPASAADGRAVRTVRRDLAAGDGDIARRDELTATDARAVVSAVGVDLAAVNVDIIGCGVAIHVLQRFPAAPADTGSSIAALGDDGAAPERWVRLRAEVHICAVTVHIQVEQTFCDIAGRPASSYARRFIATLTRHRGALHHLHAQLPLAAVLLNGRPSGGPRQLTVPVDKVQIRRRLSVQLDGRCLGVLVHLNVNVVQKNVRCRLLSIDLDLLGPDKVRIA